jgi:hypothetical protein
MSFGINPVKGGSPPNARIRIVIDEKAFLSTIFIVVSCFVDVTFLKLKIINRGLIIEQ